MNAREEFLCAALFFGSLLGGCSAEPQPGSDLMKMQLSSPAFSEGQSIPQKYTGQGDDVSPPLTWSGAPMQAKSFALTTDDPDAPVGDWVHWVIYDLPAGQTSLPENVARTATLPDGSRQGINDFKETGYGGPMPPPGKPHRYFFRIYALDTMLTLKAGATRDQLLEAMKGHVIAEGQLMGAYQRR